MALKVLSVVLLVGWVFYLLLFRKDGWKALAHSGLLIGSVLVVYTSVHFLEPYVKDGLERVIIGFLVCFLALLIGKGVNRLYYKWWDPPEGEPPDEKGDS